jgi:geranylgeranyl diphosphate synthase, type II
MNFDQELKQKTAEMEELLKKFIPSEEGCQKTVVEAMNYSLMAGGKRLRPMLMSETYQLFEGQNYALLEPFMAAIEMIHTYSLVHDDLPAMDNDEYRRGRKTTHVVYGEAMGILAGDGLLNFAFETAVKAFDVIASSEEANKAADYERISKALRVLSLKAGIYGMIGGQVIDMEEYKGKRQLERLNLMYQLKTGALIEASMMIGAILAGANKEEIEKIQQIAGAVGLAFQIQDDILDVTSTQEVLGKPIHSDEKNEKTTYVTLIGLSKAKEEVVRISNLATTAYKTLPFQNEFLERLINMLISRDK